MNIFGGVAKRERERELRNRREVHDDRRHKQHHTRQTNTLPHLTCGNEPCRQKKAKNSEKTLVWLCRHFSLLLLWRRAHNSIACQHKNVNPSYSPSRKISMLMCCSRDRNDPHNFGCQKKKGGQHTQDTIGDISNPKNALLSSAEMAVRPKSAQQWISLRKKTNKEGFRATQKFAPWSIWLLRYTSGMHFWGQHLRDNLHISQKTKLLKT